MKFKLLLILFVIFSYSIKAQLSTACYLSNNTMKIGLAYNFKGRLWTEVRMYNLSEFEDFSTDFILACNLWKKEMFNYYLGASIGGSGIALPTGFQVRPFEQNKTITFHFEVMPYYASEFVSAYCSVGIRFNLERKTE